jgi:SAM-dependent MidA family methyltransferase
MPTTQRKPYHNKNPLPPLNNIKKKFLEGSFPLDFADFMRQALYHPQYGYYHQNKPIIGNLGDFITAPEISPLFSQCLGNAIISYTQQKKSSLKEFCLLELGAGNGTMAFDLLYHWNQMGKRPKKYQILELSAPLRENQKKKLQQLPDEILSTVEWIDQLPPKVDKRIIIANEVVDALPCSIGSTLYLDNQWWWSARKVDYQQQQFLWIDEQPKPSLPEEIDESFCQHKRIIEIPQHLSAWLSALRQTMDNGLMLLIDYADYDTALKHSHPNGTLRCYHQHSVHTNPLINIGNQDITYHLNIDLLASQLKKANWCLDSVQTQAHFLLNNGIQDINMETLKDQQRWQLANQIQQLTSPSGMGERYKLLMVSC